MATVMTASKVPANVPPSPPLMRWLWVVAVFISIYAGLQNLETIARVGGVLPGTGSFGFQGFKETASFSGQTAVTKMARGSPADRAGIVVGDIVRPDPSWSLASFNLAGDRASVEVWHAGATRRVVLVAAPDSGDVDLNQLRYSIAISISALVGIVILARSKGRLDAILLAMGLIAFGRPYMVPEAYETHLLPYPLLYGVDVLLNAISFQCLVGFAISFDAESRGATLRWALPLFWITTVIELVAWSALWATDTWLLPGHSFLYQAAFQSFALPALAAVAVLVAGRRQASPAIRRRYTLTLLALVPLLASQIISNQLYTSSIAEWTASPVQVASDLLSGVLTPGLLAYAILREKVIDLGFAINRTLIFSIVSAILLTTFGISEWAVEHVLKVEGREANAVIDAGIALGLFLGFHRIQHSVRHFVERLFFHEWQAAEQALRTFVRRASFVTQAERLAADFAIAAGWFVGGAQAAIYLRGEGGAFVLATGDLAGAPDVLDPDHAPMLAIRAELQPVELDGNELPGALLVPMPIRHELGGVLLLGAKASGEPYRPDQIELLGWAAGQIGLDLNALEVERLEGIAERQRGEIAELNAVVGAIGRLTRAPA